MPDLKRSVLVGAAAALVLMAAPLAAQGPEKPNILVIWVKSARSKAGRA